MSPARRSSSFASGTASVRSTGRMTGSPTRLPPMPHAISCSRWLRSSTSRTLLTAPKPNSRPHPAKPADALSLATWPLLARWVFRNKARFRVSYWSSGVSRVAIAKVSASRRHGFYQRSNQREDKHDEAVNRNLAPTTIIAVAVIAASAAHADDHARNDEANRYKVTKLVSDIKGEAPKLRPALAECLGCGVFSCRQSVLGFRQRHRLFDALQRRRHDTVAAGQDSATRRRDPR